MFTGAQPPAVARASGLRTAPIATAGKPSWTIAPSGALPPNILFSVNFDSDCSQDPPAPPPSPPSPFATPLGFTVTNADMRTPAGAVAYVTDAWIVREDFSFNVTDCAMFSTSWYNPAGAADDWAAFPAASFTPTDNTQLRWNAITYDPDYPDGYEVRYSTAGTTPANFLANPPLFTIGAENTNWTARSLMLPAALAGTPLRLAFRNNSNDKFLLLIDDIVIEHLVDFDPTLNALEDASGTARYARVPAFLQYPLDLEATVGNAGLMALTKVTAQADALVDGASAASFTSTPVPLAADATADVEFGIGVYGTPGVWTVEGQVSATEGDEVPTNSVLEVPLLEVTANEITRAQGDTTGTLGIGADVRGELGVDFEIPTDARLTSIRITYNNGDSTPDNPEPDPDGDGIGDMNGKTMEAVVRAWNEVDDEPGELVLTVTADVANDLEVGDTVVLDFAVPAGTFPGAGPLSLRGGRATGVHPGRASDHGALHAGHALGELACQCVRRLGQQRRLRHGIRQALQDQRLPHPAHAGARRGRRRRDAGRRRQRHRQRRRQRYGVGPGRQCLGVGSGTTDGDLQFAADGAYTYTPDPDFNGTDSFDYTLCDVDNDCDTATVTLTVDPVDDLPVAEDDAFTVGPQQAFAGSVAGNDTSVDGPQRHQRHGAARQRHPRVPAGRQLHLHLGRGRHGRGHLHLPALRCRFGLRSGPGDARRVAGAGLRRRLRGPGSAVGFVLQSTATACACSRVARNSTSGQRSCISCRLTRVGAR